MRMQADRHPMLGYSLVVYSHADFNFPTLKRVLQMKLFFCILVRSKHLHLPIPPAIPPTNLPLLKHFRHFSQTTNIRII
jgi:hypothetical protein